MVYNSHKIIKIRGTAGETPVLDPERRRTVSSLSSTNHQEITSLLPDGPSNHQPKEEALPTCDHHPCYKKLNPTSLFPLFLQTRWPVWDVDLRTVTLNDKAAALQNLEGAEGKLTMNNGRSFDFKIHNVKPNENVSYITKLPGAQADWYWNFKQASAEEVELKMGVTFTGTFTFAYKLLLGGMLGPAFDVCTRNLKTLIEDGKVDGKEVECGV
ncbi:hypothetical protein HDV05_008002 [Chytridiales sp. JEL 0842]|nr:hypothetical protein HDV05_008002 [Chytridiales sp. JEL 0842]